MEYQKEVNIKIEKDVELPPIYRQYKYPFKDMKVGDSFFVECNKKETGVRGSMQWAKKRYGFMFVSRRREEKINSKVVVGVRVWRVE